MFSTYIKHNLCVAISHKLYKPDNCQIDIIDYTGHTVSENTAKIGIDFSILSKCEFVLNDASNELTITPPEGDPVKIPIGRFFDDGSVCSYENLEEISYLKIQVADKKAFMSLISDSIKIECNESSLNIYQSGELVIEGAPVTGICDLFGALRPAILEIVNNNTETVMKMISTSFPFPQFDEIKWTGETNAKIKYYFQNLV